MKKKGRIFRANVAAFTGGVGSTWGFLLCWLKNIYWSSRSLISYSPGSTNKAEQQNITSTSLTLLGSGW